MIDHLNYFNLIVEKHYVKFEKQKFDVNKVQVIISMTTFFFSIDTNIVYLYDSEDAFFVVMHRKFIYMLICFILDSGLVRTICRSCD